MTDLLNCPFCGSESVSQDSTPCTDEADYIWFKCDGCGVESEGEHGRDAALAQWNRRPHAPVSRPGDGVEGERDMSGETFAGFRVAAWRYRQAGETDKLPHHYAEHWSTPGTSAWGIQRLFTEDQLLAALTPPAETVSRPAGEGEREAVARIVEGNLARIIPLLEAAAKFPDGHFGCHGNDAKVILSALLSDEALGIVRNSSDEIVSVKQNIRHGPAAPDAGGGVDPVLFDHAWKMVQAIRGGGTPPFLTPQQAADAAAPYLLSRMDARNALQPRGER